MCYDPSWNSSTPSGRASPSGSTLFQSGTAATPTPPPEPSPLKLDELEAASRASTDGRCRLVLRLRPESERQKRVILPAMDRDRSRVDPDLAQVVRDLLTGRADWPLFLHGPVGTGKTRAVLCLADAVGGGVEYVTLSKAINDIIAASRGTLHDAIGKVTVQRWWRQWEDAKLSILDEIGTRTKATDVEYDHLKQLLDAREGKPAVVISNLDPDGMEQAYDARIASRLCMGTVYELAGNDRRIGG